MTFAVPLTAEGCFRVRQNAAIHCECRTSLQLWPDATMAEYAPFDAYVRPGPLFVRLKPFWFQVIEQTLINLIA
jgi:hypothetical protein